MLTQANTELLLLSLKAYPWPVAVLCSLVFFIIAVIFSILSSKPREQEKRTRDVVETATTVAQKQSDEMERSRDAADKFFDR